MALVAVRGWILPPPPPSRLCLWGDQGFSFKLVPPFLVFPTAMIALGLQVPHKCLLLIFSVIGACQLKVDFDYVKVWLTSKVSEPSDETRSGIANLDIFRHLDEAARLLMIQPKTKKKLSLGNGYGKQSVVHASTVSGSSAISSTSCYDDEPEASEARIFPSKDEWLNLRLRNGKRRIPLVIPDCLKASEQA